MSDSPLPDADPRATAQAEAAAWFSRLRSQPTAAQRQDFASWQAASPAHARAYDEMEAAWSATAAPGHRVAEEEAGRLEFYLAAMDAAKAARRRKTTRRAAGAGAALLLLLGAGTWLERPGLLQDLGTDHVTARGERRQVALPDGSTALLDADSALASAYTAGERRVRLLRGVAYFEVLPSAIPFVVEAAGGEIRVLGTKFDVRVLDAEAIVTLAEGRVAVTASGGHAVLEPGQRLRFGRDGLQPAETASLDQALSWQSGRFAFYRMPLAEVLEEVGRYRPGRILILDRGLGAREVSGSFSLADTDAALASLQASLGFRLRVLAGRLVVITP
ncbi:FecR family protein [Roseococcus pinisoli]|uniref:FecR domain-containing protein n=1 Tax=Roseococcus pinisoli TaxID=2835040 RepID=A0ABS5QBW6_9PROT|nr:FecR domain-containing protein [Roseococcus pinisoli]MBS7810078.1 FecR domain-containing protein [Roseococcus pinisoli]